ncbi:ubiquinol-cytochrome c reductase iron-sulfur subunit [Acetobacter orleanensis]|uniref:Ubiquinol-cytochrome c reductase iron-sulfur subunit n=1 Tax=Acetobacter orleanensis TaxID=104099 RepID=A0A4Y3TJZ1_9PROT|nr:ubiquinol-cytochrome c reductase iron-sulfur subunit [Acetobacter orleanensis]KXV63031.1 ubiquinol-cytochrome C reductase [Acetobacter orleanensis]PCD78818.1 ubiquinol-cytochrome c reductase iron-sulfur subunit [Acetobacter orleanensis]GAN68810.1 ubiquinol-cytochrome c reductase iron-sulfur subunit [Acetobacter orleanensis JCM 7639]GBR24368.1 ubiquinol-cytochrome c reductase iron-sulfur subunit [Acetobacter orleanensis NRIC 0473]GEB83301.1 ubiquinol-cytochrome c reductase iron-sulfur subuni
MTHPADDTHPTGQDQDNAAGRRDFLGMVTTAGTVTGLAACAIPFVASLKPQDSAAAHLPVDVDLSKLAPGQQMTAVWQGKPIFILRRTAEDLAKLQDPKLVEQLRDAQSDALQQPTYARNWHRSLVPDYGVYVGICTHLGCVPAYTAPAAAPDQTGRYACPCHGSQFDLAGRVFKGAPAPYNLPVPPYVLPTPTTLRLGENPKGESFDFSTIEQI